MPHRDPGCAVDTLPLIRSIRARKGGETRRQGGQVLLQSPYQGPGLLAVPGLRGALQPAKAVSNLHRAQVARRTLELVGPRRGLRQIAPGQVRFELRGQPTGSFQEAVDEALEGIPKVLAQFRELGLIEILWRRLHTPIIAAGDPDGALRSVR